MATERRIVPRASVANPAAATPKEEGQQDFKEEPQHTAEEGDEEPEPESAVVEEDDTEEEAQPAAVGRPFYGTEKNQAPPPTPRGTAPAGPTKVVAAVAIKNNVSAAERVVEVHAMKDHECSIAGITYSVKEGKSYKMPQHVAVILSRAKVVFKK